MLTACERTASGAIETSRFSICCSRRLSAERSERSKRACKDWGSCAKRAFQSVLRDCCTLRLRLNTDYLIRLVVRFLGRNYKASVRHTDGLAINASALTLYGTTLIHRCHFLYAKKYFIYNFTTCRMAIILSPKPECPNRSSFLHVFTKRFGALDSLTTLPYVIRYYFECESASASEPTRCSTYDTLWHANRGSQNSEASSTSLPRMASNHFCGIASIP